MLATLAREALPDTAVVDVVDSALTARPLRVLAPLPVDPDNTDGDALTGFARASVPAGALVRRLPPYLGIHRPPPVRAFPPTPAISPENHHLGSTGLCAPAPPGGDDGQAVEKRVEGVALLRPGKN